MLFPTATGRTTASIGLLAALASLLLASPSLAAASSEIKHASLQGLLLERQEIAEFFAPENHNTPRHAAAAAPPSFDSAHAHAHHHRRHSKRGQCMKRPKAAAAVAKGSSSAAPTPSTSELAQHRGQGTSTDGNSNNNDNGDDSSSSSSSKNQVELQPTESSSSSRSEQTKEGKAKPTDGGNVSPIIPNTGNGGSSVLGGVGLYTFVDKQCGKSGATKDVTKIAGPNGAMDFLNCGLDGSGWTPPDVKLSDVLVMELDEALEDPNSPFQACKPFLSIFDKYAKVNDLPAILLASIAMQESTCNPNASGDNGGAYGLMQITGDKCTKGISCSDPDYNVKTGAAYLKSRLDANDGNILLAMGEYNGWYRGLTIAKATAIKDQCCQCQNNVNYHMQMLNGWLLNKNGYELGDWVMGC